MIGSFVIAKLYFYLSFFFHFYLLISFPPLVPSFLNFFPFSSINYLYFPTSFSCTMSKYHIHLLIWTILPQFIKALFYLLSMPINIYPSCLQTLELYFTCCRRCPSATSVSWYSWPHSGIPPLSTDPHLQWWISHPHPMAHTPREGQVKKMN